MGLFDMFKKKDAAPSFPVVLAADAAGAFVKMEDIPDEVFAQGILGQGCGIDPSEGKVYAPCDGEITQAPDTLHAFGITTPGGVEVLIHVGVDTVEMKGDGFESKVKLGSKVTKGQLPLTMDLNKIKAAGHPAVVITVVTNTDDFASVDVVASGNVNPGDDMMKVNKQSGRFEKYRRHRLWACAAFGLLGFLMRGSSHWGKTMVRYR